MKNKFYIIWSITTAIIVGIVFFLSKDDSPLTRNVMLLGTAFMAGITLLSFTISIRSLLHENPNRFVRGVMGGTFLKFLLSIVGVAILLFTYKKQLHKPDLYVLMIEYVIFSIIETGYMSIVSRKKS